METVILLDTQVKLDKIPELTRGEQIHIITTQGGTIPVELLELCSAHTFKLHFVAKPYNNVEIALVIGMILESAATQDLLFIGKNETIARLAGKEYQDAKGKMHRIVTLQAAQKQSRVKSSVKSQHTVKETQQTAAAPASTEQKMTPAKKPVTEKKAAAAKKTAPVKEYASVAAVLKAAGIDAKYKEVLMAAVASAMDPLTLEMMLRMQAATMQGVGDLDAAAVSEAAKPYFDQLKKLQK